jgi:hypothetical protein
MKEEMLVKLAEFFRDNGPMNRVEFRASKAAPYTLRDVERTFKKYSSMLYQVNQVQLPEKKVVEPVKKAVPKKKVKTEDSLNEGNAST